MPAAAPTRLEQSPVSWPAAPAPSPVTGSLTLMGDRQNDGLGTANLVEDRERKTLEKESSNNRPILRREDGGPPLRGLGDVVERSGDLGRQLTSQALDSSFVEFDRFTKLGGGRFVNADWHASPVAANGRDPFRDVLEDGFTIDQPGGAGRHARRTSSHFLLPHFGRGRIPCTVQALEEFFRDSGALVGREFHQRTEELFGSLHAVQLSHV